MHKAVAGSFLLVCVLSPAAHAADCGLKLVNTIPITLAAGGLRPLVPVTINGTTQTFLLDTGGAATQISATAAQELKLPLTESPVKMLDLYGHASTTAARVETFGLGRLVDRNTELPVLPNPNFGKGGLFSGLLAGDYMARYDLEFDFAGGKLNYISPDHCEGKVVYWPTTGIGVVPMTFRDHHLIIPVTLNGKTFNAIIDTGAPGTTLTAPEAKRVFDVTADSSGSTVLGEDHGQKTFERVFDALSFEGVTVNNPHVTVIPNLVGSRDANNGLQTGSLIKRVDDMDSSAPPMQIGRAHV